MVDTVKSASITNLDANSLLFNTSGEGGPGLVRELSDYVAATASGLQSTSSTYRAIRLPSNCIMKSLFVETTTGADTSTGLTIDVGAYYSDSPNFDGTAAANNGNSISVNCFLANTAFGQSSGAQRLYAFSGIAVNLRTSQLWKQVGLTSDPGGFIDVVVAVHTAASTGIASNILVSASYQQ